jgi:hypothetical protein
MRAFAVLVLVSFALALLVTEPTHAAIAVGSECHNAAGAGGGGTVSCTVPVTAGDAIVVCTPSAGSADEPTTVTDDKGDVFTEIIFTSPGATQPFVALHVALNAIGGSTVITAQPAQDFDKGVAAVAISGIATTSAVASNAASAANSGTTASTPAVTGSSGGLALGCVAVFNSGTFTPNVAWTQISEDETFANVAFNFVYKTSTGSDAPSWTIPDSQWAATALLLNAFTAGGSVCTRSLIGVGC